MLFCCTLIFFQVNFSEKYLSEKYLSVIPSERQTVWIQIRPDGTLFLIWVQTVAKVISRRNWQHRVKGGYFMITDKKFNGRPRVHAIVEYLKHQTKMEEGEKATPNRNQRITGNL